LIKTFPWNIEQIHGVWTVWGKAAVDWVDGEQYSEISLNLPQQNLLPLI
jgi:hypothetical protein